jgi:histidinol dehydrogenase
MTILTAKVAGVANVIGCTPPIAGKIPNATVAAMHFAGADEIFILGGVQAVAAMAVGTETIRKADFIAGPGNAFVAEAKRQLFGEVGIDLFAGPTEILIVADEHADPFTIATDLISQAEHGPDTPAVLITTSASIGREAITHVTQLLERSDLSTADIAGTSWKAFGEVIVVSNLDEAYALADDFAFEHVQIFTQKPREALEKMSNYGALFLGEKTCVSYGDKVCVAIQCFMLLLTCILTRSSVLITFFRHEKLLVIPEDCGLASIFELSRIRRSPPRALVGSLEDSVDVQLVPRHLKDMLVPGI